MSVVTDWVVPASGAVSRDRLALAHPDEAVSAAREQLKKAAKTRVSGPRLALTGLPHRLALSSDICYPASSPLRTVRGSSRLRDSFGTGKADANLIILSFEFLSLLQDV
ncbi:hypothetical protein K438DRAFT_1756845 [Mycena galopus ATCC 62051]|nr:hypothetical protein K438DRAFT_1756845 [Mycena galopus ATCC 62051]